MWRWVGPLATLLVFAGVVLVLHHQLARLHVRSVLQHLHAIARARVLAALAFTALSYWLLTTYEVLALRYLRRSLPYTRILFTSLDRKSTRLNSSHGYISYAVFCLKKKTKIYTPRY